jgi:penicillin-binding protein activator
MKKLIQLSLLTTLSIFASCSSTKYGDAQETETVNADWGSTDLQVFSKKMSDSLAAAPNLAYLDGPGKRDDKRVVIYLGGIENKTSEHIDTTAITDKISTELFKSGRFKIVADTAGQKEIGDQVRFQNDGRVDPEQARKFGKQLGADVVLHGTLRSIEKKKGRSLETGGVKTEDVYYQFVFKAVNIETAELLWQEEGEIRKQQKSGLFGS